MGERLLSVGLDVGTTTTQLIVSRLCVENKASSFAVPELEIAEREILYRSKVWFTPLLEGQRVDGEAIAAWVKGEYEKANIRPEDVQTGAVIITGETSRKENAKAVLDSLSHMAGDFVVATAGPDLESVLAAKGAGALAYSEETGETVLHIDIGGGTSNLALIENGRVTRTGCLNVGGRLVKLAGGRVSYLSPAVECLTELQVGDTPTEAQLRKVAGLLTQGLEMAAGKRPATELFARLQTKEVVTPWKIPEKEVVVSFSGGVADCIAETKPYLQFGDIGPLLGNAIRQSSLCKADYVLGRETIRATVIGAGCHSTQLSGSTVFCRGVTLPKKNLPVIGFSRQEQEQENFAQKIADRLAMCDSEDTVLAMEGYESPDYSLITQLAEKILKGVGNRPVYLCLQTDMAKALGQKLSLLAEDKPCLCLDRLKFTPESYLDIGLPVGPCFPVVIKTLVLSNMQ